MTALRGADLAQGPDVDALCAAVGRPLVVTVDDVHLLGADEAGLLGRLLDRVASAPVLCVLAYRRRQLAPGPAAALAGAAAGRLRVAQLGPLTREQAAIMIGDRPDAEEIYREAAGYPQYIKLLCTLRDTGSTAEAGAAILGELAGLDPEALAAVRGAAVIGEPFSAALLADVTGLDEPAAVRALDRLTGVDLVRPAERGPHLALRHRAVGEAVYERLEPSRRFALHQRAADALAEQGAPVARRVRHVTRAADPHNPEHVRTLIAAARATIYTSPATAAEYLQAARPLLREGHEHAHELHVLLARARLLSDELSEGRALLDALRSAGPGQADAAALDSSRIERRLGRHFEAGALARSGLAALAEADSAGAAALYIELADGAYDVQDYESSRLYAETAAEIAARHGDYVGQAHALAQSALGHLFTDDDLTALARAGRAAELIDAAPDTMLLTNLAAPVQLGMTEGLLGRLSDCERHLARAEALARRTGQTYLDGQLLTVLANAQCRLGKLRAAMVTLERVERRREELGELGLNPSEEAVAANLRGATLYWRDEPGDAERSAAEAERALAVAGDSSTTWAMTVRCFQAELVLFAGEPLRARSLLLEAGGEDLAGISPVRRPRWSDTLAEVALALGEGAEAERWAAIAEGSPQRPSTPRSHTLRARMWAHAACGEPEAALVCAQEAVREFSTRGERIEVCRTPWCAGSAPIYPSTGVRRGRTCAAAASGSVPPGRSTNTPGLTGRPVASRGAPKTACPQWSQPSTVPRVTYLSPLAYLLGVEGAALLRGLRDGTGDRAFVEARIAEIRTLLADPALAGSPGIEAVAGGISTGEVYRQWAPTYDGPNSMIESEEPLVRAIVDGLPIGTALDAACGTGRHAKHLAGLGHRVVGLDASGEMLAIAAQKVPGAVFHRAELTAMPLADGSVDLAVCALALCHVPDLAPVFAEFARVLRPGGHLVVSDPHVLLSYLRPMLARTPGPDGRPTTFVEYHRGLSEYLAAALPVGFQVRHCAEPGIPTKDSTTAHVPTVIPGSSAPQLDWELLGWIPEAVTAVMNLPSIVLWHFQLADAGNTAGAPAF
ncbi:methyltransferase domain-containing protein [Actinospica robiniae]|uniref:methyltransferase domain-containing protein n=1 Tax=Actinospica robiniae TaxID=304901 RepID=UPI001B7F8590|nr:methyltransferase domain-containing protein [Actinospica robiniae]